MISILWGVCCYLYVVWRVVWCGEWLPEEPVVYVGFRRDKGVCVLGGEMCKACGVAEMG